MNKRKQRFFQAACVVLVAATLLWIGLNIRWHAAGQRAVLSHSFAKARAGERMPVTVPHGSVSINTATLDELCTLKGIGPALAAAIVAEREARGAFCFPEDLLCIKGIGEKKLAGLMDQMTLE